MHTVFVVKQGNKKQSVVVKKPDPVYKLEFVPSGKHTSATITQSF